MAESSYNFGRGRGHIFQKLKNEKEKELNKLKKINIHDSEVPSKSTFISKEISDIDNSIYETGIDSGINFDKLNEDKVIFGCMEVPQKVENFDSISIKLKENIKKCKLKKLTPIQKYTIPIILSGKDLMGAAQTGSGKTIAYVLPIIHMLIEKPSTLVVDSNHCQPQVIIISPTRELAVQIHVVVIKFIRGTGISSLVCYGGTSISRQKKQILKGCHILVATPGRLYDILQYGSITLESLRFFVLDEIDKLLEVDLKVIVDRIIDHPSTPSSKNRQTIMLSATLPDSIQNLAKYYLKHNYIFLSIGVVNTVSRDITQTFYQTTKENKQFLLRDILCKNPNGTIVFVNEKWTADFLATYLSEYDIPTTSIHGDRSQKSRETALYDFSVGNMYVIVTTAVASRGLDIKCIQRVINYDMPENIEEYIQRVGRTGRLGNLGTAISLFDLQCDSHLTKPIVQILSQANQEIPTWLRAVSEIDLSSINNKEEFEYTDVRSKLNVGIYEIEEW